MRRCFPHVLVPLVLAILAAPAPSHSAGVVIRPDRMVEIDGEPFFPIGLMEMGAPEFEDWNARIRQSGANVVWDFMSAYADTSPSCAAIVDSARVTGYRLLLGSYDTLWWDDPATPEYEVSAPIYEDEGLDALVECMGREPGIMLGFTNRDEPVWTLAQGWLGDIDSAHVHETYRQIHDRVDSTLVAMNFAPVHVSGDFDTWKAELLPFVAATDVVMHAAYPYPAGPGTCGPLNVLGWPDCTMDRLADNADLYLAEINRPDQPLWMIVQSFKSIPLRESRWTAYASIVHGATGIFWAGWTWVHPLGGGEEGWPVTVEVVSEMASLHDFLVGADLGGAESSHPDVEVRVKRHRTSNEAVAFAISRNGYAGPVEIRLPGLAADPAGVEVVREDRSVTATGGRITDHFEAHEAHGYRYSLRPTFSPALTRFSLRAYPSPTEGPVTLELALPSESRVTLTVHDAAGRRVRSLEAQRFPAGPREIPWDGRDGVGRPVAPGVYFLRAEASPGGVATARVLVRR